MLGIIFFIPHGYLFAQQQQSNITAGFQFSPNIPSRVFRTGPISGAVGTTAFTVKQKVGYDLGIVLQGRIWKNLWFQTGITLDHRNYSLEIKQGDFDSSSTFSVLYYSIPFSILVNTPISQSIYFNNSLGVVADIYPSDETTFGSYYVQQAYRVHEVNFALTANTGFKFSTNKYGAFYVGASYHLPFKNAYYSGVQNTHDAAKPVWRTYLTGNYSAVNLIYFFVNNTQAKK